MKYERQPASFISRCSFSVTQLPGSSSPFRPGKPFRAIAAIRPRSAQRLCECSGQRRDLPVEIVFPSESRARRQSRLDDESGRLRTRNCTDIMPPRLRLP